MYTLTATCSDSYIENSKNHKKKVVLPIITSPNVLLNNNRLHNRLQSIFSIMCILYFYRAMLAQSAVMRQ